MAGGGEWRERGERERERYQHGRQVFLSKTTATLRINSKDVKLRTIKCVQY